MVKKIKINKSTAIFSLHTIITFLLITVLYFFFLLAPKAMSTKKLTQTKIDLEDRRLLLSENKILYDQFLSLNPTSLTYYEEKQDLLSQVEKSLGNLEKHFLHSPAKRKSNVFTTKATKELITKINKREEPIYQSAKNSLLSQKESINQLKESESLLGKLSAYQPAVDLSDLENKEKTVLRAQTATGEIQKIEKNIKLSNLDSKDKISEKIQISLVQLENFTNSLDSAATAKALENLASLNESYDKLKIEMFKSQARILISDKSLEDLNKLETSINELEVLIKEINALQKDLANDPLYKIFTQLATNTKT